MSKKSARRSLFAEAYAEYQNEVISETDRLVRRYRFLQATMRRVRERLTHRRRVVSGSRGVGATAVQNRRTHLWNSYGISEKEYWTMNTRQGSRCAICGQFETRRDHDSSLYLSVDHDHRTGKIRGLLCNHCNTGLGSFRDNPARLRAAALYLEEKGI